MSDAATKFHETWLGMVQPSDGLVVSIPTLVEAQCWSRQAPELQQRVLEHCPLVQAKEPEGPRYIADFETFLAEILGLTPDLFDGGEAIPPELCLYVPEGGQTLRPTLALRHLSAAPGGSTAGETSVGGADTPDVDTPSSDGSASDTPANRAGLPYVMLLWEVPDGLLLHKAETETGPWEYPPAAKFDRLLRECRVPIGLLTNRREIRLFYAPHGESSGSITFRVDDMTTVGGRPILDALLMLLSAERFFAVAEEHQLPALLAESRRRQANVTNELAEQVFLALETLLRGFEAAAQRDGREKLADAALQGEDHLYGGLLTVLLRLVFVLYAEDRNLLPVDQEVYSRHLGAQALFDDLRTDHGAYPDSMDRRFGGWGRLLTLFRAIYLGVKHGDFIMPARRGQLFDPNLFPFLEGWQRGGTAPLKDYEQREAVRVPSIDDETVYRLLEKLIVFQGQRLSYRTLDVEQIGSVYEALMGYHVIRVVTPAVCLRPSRCWIEVGDLLEVPQARRAKWLQEMTSLAKGQAGKLAKQLAAVESEEAILEVLAAWRVKGTEMAQPERLVIQPGAERRRTSSHYTPRSLSAPIVKRTLEPLLKCMGEAPASDRLLELKICDPAMGSGAFLVEACRYLADEVVAAWTREGKIQLIGNAHEEVGNHARRLVAQRCLYGVDKNAFAVNLAKLSLWLVTLAEDLPFTFLDHALRHGDSLVGLDFKQIRGFHWRPEQQQFLCSRELDTALSEAISRRQEILELAGSGQPGAQQEKEALLREAEFAVDDMRLVGDLVVGAFFAEKKDKARKLELARRLELVSEWLKSGKRRPDDLREMQRAIRKRTPVFHWMLEFPEVFYGERPDPLEEGRVNKAAFFDAFIGNPPFAGKNGISEFGGPGYLDWLQAIHIGAHGNADYSAHFFRLADRLLGRHGTLGLIATNTISQGDTRATGLQAIVKSGHMIYDATRSMTWPGAAAVAVSVIHSAKGRPTTIGTISRLDGTVVESINSRLKPKPERTDPAKLIGNSGLGFVGSYVLGMGFILTPEEHEGLITKNPGNGERMFPYLGGEEVNSSSRQSHRRFVISFGQMSLEEAEAWPDLIAIVREKVKPERDRNKREVRRKYWWRFGEVAPALYEAISPLHRCIVTSIHSKHLIFSFLSSTNIFSHALYVFSLESYTGFTVVQSRIHEPWARLHSSSMKNDLRYTASDCFETFPFPQPDPRTQIPELEDIGESLHDRRAQYMIDTQQGLTQTYNHLKDPTCTDPEIQHLRHLHEEMDRAVLHAYGWDHIEVPPYVSPTSEAERQALEAFQDEVIDHLFVLNAERAEEEALQGLVAGKGKGGKKPAKAKASKAKNTNQMTLLGI